MICPSEEFKDVYPHSKPSGLPVVVTWTVAPELPYLQGHFPQNPILPAIAIIDASTYLLQCALGRPELEVKVVNAAKFLSPIVPGQSVNIEAKPIADGQYQIEWRDGSSGPCLASLLLQAT